jgi:hypothetical protein
MYILSYFSKKVNRYVDIPLFKQLTIPKITLMLALGHSFMENIPSMATQFESELEGYENIAPHIVDLSDLKTQLGPVNDSPESMFVYYKSFWDKNGGKTGTSPRDDKIVVENFSGFPFAIFRSAYKGLTSEGVTEREEKLQRYNYLWLKLLAENDGCDPDTKLNDVELKMKKEKLYISEVGLQHSNGIQGVETFTFNVTASLAMAGKIVRDKQSVPNADVATWHTYALPEEQILYATPDYLSAYPRSKGWTENTYSNDQRIL